MIDENKEENKLPSPEVHHCTYLTAINKKEIIVVSSIHSKGIPNEMFSVN